MILLLLPLMLIAAPSEKVRVALKWFYQYQFAGLIMAKEKGFYHDAGLEVELIERDPKQDYIMQVINGDAEYGVADSSILTYRAKGFPVKTIATIFQHNAMVMLSHKGSGIVSPYEMKGKRIMYQKGIDDAIFQSMFAYADIHSSHYTKLPMDFSYERFIQKETDVIAAYITDQPYTLKARGVDVNIINPLSYGIDLYGDTLFTTEQEIAEHPERVARFKEASLKGWAYALAHKEETIQIIRDHYKPTLSFDQLMYEAHATERLIAAKFVPLGYTSKDRFKTIAEYYSFLEIPSDSLLDAVDTLLYDPDAPTHYNPLYIRITLIVLGIVLIIALIQFFYSRRLETLIKRRTAELEKAKMRAEEAAVSKARFLANMSHEIRTPMNAILGFVEQLFDNESDNHKLQHLSIIKNSGQTLLAIINDILDFSKIESGKMTLDPNPHPIHQMIHETKALFHDLAAGKKIDLQTDLTDALPTHLIIDSVRLKQVIFNFLSNAIKFTPDGGSVTLRADYDQEQQRFFCSVEDTGIGISPEQQSRIFNAFDQADNTTTRQYGGTGLGLAISSQLIDLMQGAITVRSKIGVGSCFSFEIPVAPTKVSVTNSPKKSQKEKILQPRHLLIVEDNRNNQMLLGLILKKIGMHYDIANDGVEAVAAFKKRDYDLIFMDENMPNKSGIEATIEIRSYESAINKLLTPIIAVTANALEEDRKRFMAAGVNEYITKPYNAKQIRSVLERYLGS
jgi:signal transduction histidine kinase/ABC-type nitrate/sulfonate/bicarbonate transport system substrate-binding protein/CheY-like chemotaxis protein